MKKINVNICGFSGTDILKIVIGAIGIGISSSLVMDPFNKKINSAVVHNVVDNLHDHDMLYTNDVSVLNNDMGIYDAKKFLTDSGYDVSKK